MRTEQLISIMPRQSGDYRFGWIFSFLVAIASAPFIVIFQHSASWLIAVPIVFGAAVILITEWKLSAVLPPDSEIFESLPRGFSGLKSYEQFLALTIQSAKKTSKNQLSLFDAFPEPTPVNSIRTLYDNNSKEISAVNCDRFSALLITYLIENMDTATEKSLRAGLSRFGELGKGNSDIKMFVHDKTIREAIKTDFRGNLLTLISRGGEKVVKDLLKAAAAEKEKQIEKEKAEAERAVTSFQLH
jgi:hypothetical protein